MSTNCISIASYNQVVWQFYQLDNYPLFLIIQNMYTFSFCSFLFIHSTHTLPFFPSFPLPQNNPREFAPSNWSPSIPWAEVNIFNSKQKEYENMHMPLSFPSSLFPNLENLLCLPDSGHNQSPSIPWAKSQHFHLETKKMKICTRPFPSLPLFPLPQPHPREFTPPSWFWTQSISLHPMGHSQHFQLETKKGNTDLSLSCYILRGTAIHEYLKDGEPDMML